jgi:large subunit ribosomal protein L22
MAAVETPQQPTVRAQAKWVHSSARKARLVTDLIRGRSVPEARTILAFSQRAVAEDVEKVLRSAVANAESRPDLHWSGDDLVIVTAFADEGPTLKRHRARARGRVGRIMKRTCHITLELAQSPVVAAAADAAPATGLSRRRTGATQEPALDTTEAVEAETVSEPVVAATQEPTLETTDAVAAEAVPEAETLSSEPPVAKPKASRRKASRRKKGTDES